MSADGDGPDWLGLLKWSLAQTDGTSESDARPMSDEDVAFLAGVMETLVADEPKRLRQIMVEIAAFLEEPLTANDGEEESSNKDTAAAVGAAAKITELSLEERQEAMEDIFEELKDITCQIDMSVFFASKLCGISCILDVLENKKGLAKDSVRVAAASAIGTLSQNNMTVQGSMFKRAEISRLAGLALSLMTASELGSGVVPAADGSNVQISNPKLLAKVLYALSCSVVALPTAEEVFVRGQYGALILKSLLELPLPPSSDSISDFPVSGGRAGVLLVQRRAYRLCRALLVSDTASAERLKLLVTAAVPACYSGLACDDDMELRESAAALVVDLLKSPAGRAAIDSAGSDRLSVVLTARKSGLVAEVAAAEDDYDKADLTAQLAVLEECEALLAAPAPVATASPAREGAADALESVLMIN